MTTAKRPRRLWDAYIFPGFRPEPTVQGVFGDPKARVIRLNRRSKKRLAAAAVARRWAGMIASYGVYAICRVATHGFFWNWRCGVSTAVTVARVKRERLDFLADNPLYTKRFAYYVGRRCRSAPIRDIAKELRLDWHTVKELDKQYMRAQLAKAGTPGPTVIGIDEISVRKGHDYRIVVSDLVRQRPIWFGGSDRSEASMAQCYQWLGEKKCERIRLAVMDMWKPFRNATNAHAP